LKGQLEGIVAVAKLNRTPSCSPGDKTRILVNGRPSIKIKGLNPTSLNDSTCCLLRNGISTGAKCQHLDGDGNGIHGQSTNTNLNKEMRTGPTVPYRHTHHSPAAEFRVTKTLLLVSTVFLVLNLPSHAIRAFTFIHVRNYLKYLEFYVQFKVTHAIFPYSLFLKFNLYGNSFLWNKINMHILLHTKL
jgi:hypothetical protein